MKGAWSSTTAYAINDGVTFSGNTYVAIQAGTNHQPDTSPLYWVLMPAPLKLGVPLPAVSPTVTSSGGVSTTNQTRAYTYTWVTALGEEGPPAYPGIHTGKIDDTWHITLAAPTSLQTANRNLTKTRIYRSVTSTQGVASYFFVAEIPITTLTYDDTQLDSVIVNNEQLQSLDWAEPPADLQGLVSLPNGMVAGWRANEVWFCEQYQPHAWPLKYMIAVPTNIVGLGVLGQTVVILTEGNPWTATGIDPSQMSLAIIQPLEACTSQLSIVNTPGGVLYSSPNGLINITAGGATNLTKDMILKDQWAQIFHLPSVCAAILAQGYYAYSITSGEVFQADTFEVEDAFQTKSHFGTGAGMYLSLIDPRVAVTRLSAEFVTGTTTEVMNVITDLFNGEVMLLRDGVVYLVDVRQQAPYAKYRWRSKMFSTTYLDNLAAAKVYWTPAYSPRQGDTIFRMYAGESSKQIEDGLPLRFQQKLGHPDRPTEPVQSGHMFRLPSGYKAIYFQFEVEGFAIIDAIHAASTARELREI